MGSPWQPFWSGLQISLVSTHVTGMILLSERSGQIGSSCLVWPEALKSCCWTLLLSVKMYLLCMDRVLNAVAGQASQQLHHKPVMPAQALASHELPELVVPIFYQGQQCPEGQGMLQSELSARFHQSKGHLRR